jgi:hypothetical protein
MSGVQQPQAVRRAKPDPAGGTGTPANGHGRRGGPVAVLVWGAVAAVAACGGPPAPATAPVTPDAAAAPSPATITSDVPSVSVASAAPDPNAPEVNAPEVNAPGNIPDSQVLVPYTPPSAGFVVSRPQGWARWADSATTVFTDRFNSVRVEATTESAAADVPSARAQEVPQLQAAVAGFPFGDVREVRRIAGPVVLITYEADSAPNPVIGKSVREVVERYAFWNRGRQAVLRLSGPKGAANVDPWRTVTDSLPDAGGCRKDGQWLTACRGARGSAGAPPSGRYAPEFILRRRRAGSDGDGDDKQGGTVVDVTVSSEPSSAVVRQWDRLVDTIPGSDVAQLSAWAHVR